MTASTAVGLDEIGVRIGDLRVLVQILHVRVRRRRIEVEVVFLHVLAVVRLAVGESEHPLLEDRVLAVPQGHGEAEPLLVVGNPREPVLAPAIRPRASLVMGEVVPGVAAVTVVFANGSPLSLAEIRAPLLPLRGLAAGFFQSTVLGVHVWLLNPFRALISFTARRLVSAQPSIPLFRSSEGGLAPSQERRAV